MIEEGKKEKKLTLEETLRRIRPLFIMMMIFPLFGLIAAMVILYILQPKNLLFIEVMIFISMVLYIVTTYLAVKKMGQMGKKTTE
jgi:hypothetical protein